MLPLKLLLSGKVYLFQLHLFVEIYLVYKPRPSAEHDGISSDWIYVISQLD